MTRPRFALVDRIRPSIALLPIALRSTLCSGGSVEGTVVAASSTVIDCGAAESVWRCQSQGCVKASKRCDGIKNCADGSDEEGCPRASPCWADAFSFPRCCLAANQQHDCWMGDFTYQRCCLTHPVLSQKDVRAIAPGQNHWSCGCDRVGHLEDSVEWDWCEVRRALMLNWDVNKWYVKFVFLDNAELARCPVGALQLMATAAFSKVNSGQSIWNSAAYAWVEEMASLLLGPDHSPHGLAKWVASGWNSFFMLSHLGYHLRQVEGGGDGPACTKDGHTFLSQVHKMIEGGPAVPLSTTAAFLASLDGGACVPEEDPGHDGKPCCLPRALGLLALADAAAVNGKHDEGQELLHTASRTLRAGLRVHGRHEGHPGALSILLRSRWPVVDAMDRLFQTPQLKLSVSDIIRGFLRHEPEGPLAAGDAKTQPSFWMRVFPRREIVSDMVRFSRAPFCGMRPFMRLVERIAVGAARATCGGGQRCGLDFVEGGPHLGDCTLWAAAALESAGLASFAAAYEPLPDASALFRESVLANRWEGRVVVVPRALAARDGEKVTLAYFPGHNGEGTTVRAAAESHCGQHCAGFSEILTVSLDASWPALRPAPLEVLKLSVNGEELNALRGARTLLSKRQVCSVLVHVTKAQRGWADGAVSGAASNSFAAELWDLLSNDGGMEVSLHLDEDVTSQVKTDDVRARPSTRRLRSAKELDAVFSREASPHDYMVARQKNVTEGFPCAGSQALLHWDAVFG